VARVGGDEFVLLVEDTGTLAAVPAAVSGLLHSLTQSVYVAGEPICLTVAIGLALYPAHAHTPARLVRAAATASRAAKATGTNCWRSYDPALASAAKRRATALKELRQAFEEGGLALHYQPKVDLISGECIGFEALLRVRANGELQRPAEFIEVAEESGFIHTVTQWVVETAAAQLRSWRAQGQPPMSIAVNISPLSLRNEGFLQFLAQLARDDRTLCRHLEFEVTESAFALDSESALAALGELRALGFRLHLDDFGSGYSALAYLSRPIFHTMKIAQSFVDGSLANSQILKSIVEIAAALDLTLIAEGIETDFQLAVAKAAGCKLGQGYLLGRPMPVEQAVTFAPRVTDSSPR